MTTHRQSSARPEQPGDGGFQAPTTDEPEATRIGSFGNANEPERQEDRDGEFNDGHKTPPDDSR
jgi:hypothetical protein